MKTVLYIMNQLNNIWSSTCQQNQGTNSIDSSLDMGLFSLGHLSPTIQIDCLRT